MIPPAHRRQPAPLRISGKAGTDAAATAPGPDHRVQPMEKHIMAASKNIATAQRAVAATEVKLPVYPGLPYVTARRTPRGRHLGTVTFDVEPMSWEDGYLHGLQVAADVVAWASGASSWPNPAAVMGDMVQGAVMALGDKRREGAARAFLNVMNEFMRAGATCGNAHSYIEGRKQDFEQACAWRKTARAVGRASKRAGQGQIGDIQASK